MKLSLEAFKQLCNEIGLGLTLPESDQECLHAALAKKLGWNKGNGVDGVIAAFCQVWQQRYGSKPIIDGKSAGAAKALTELMGIPAAITLIDAYLEMNDSFYVARRHDLTTLNANINAVKLYSEGKGTVTRHELHQADRVAGERQGWDNVKKRLTLGAAK